MRETGLMGVALAAALIGVLSPFDGSAATLARLDPVSLRPAGPRVRLGEYHDAWAFSPDGSQLALGNGGQGRVCGRGVCVVDAGDMAVTSDIDTPIAVEALAWVRPRRVVAVLQLGGIVVAGKGEAVEGIQPAVLCMSALGGLSSLDHGPDLRLD